MKIIMRSNNRTKINQMWVKLENWDKEKQKMKQLRKWCMKDILITKTHNFTKQEERKVEAHQRRNIK